MCTGNFKTTVQPNLPERPTLYNGHVFLAYSPYIDSHLNLSTTATSLQRPRFLADSQYIDSHLNFSTTATFFSGQPLHWLSFELLYNRHPSTAATFFCPKGDRCGEV